MCDLLVVNIRQEHIDAALEEEPYGNCPGQRSLEDQWPEVSVGVRHIELVRDDYGKPDRMFQMEEEGAAWVRHYDDYAIRRRLNRLRKHDVPPQPITFTAFRLCDETRKERE